MATDLSTLGPLPPEPYKTSTRHQAARVAARWARTRYRQILQLLADRGGLCIFEVARAISAQENATVHDHQISGRFGALEHAELIKKAGVKRCTPTGCQAEVYQITLAGLAVLKDQPVTRASCPPSEPPSNALQTGKEPHA
jgi:hypothetical protein